MQEAGEAIDKKNTGNVRSRQADTTGKEAPEGISQIRKAEISKQERDEKIQADLQFFENTRTERDKIYQELNLQIEDIDTIEKSFREIIQGEWGKNIIRTGIMFSDKDEKRAAAILEAFDRVSVEVLGNGIWPIQSLSEFQERQDIKKFKKIEIITHPLYGALIGTEWDEKEWEESSKNIDKYLEKKLVKTAIAIVEHLKMNPSSIPWAYPYLMDAVEEIEAMQIPPEEGTLRVYNMPRRSLLPAGQREAMDQLLKKYPSENTATMDSYHKGTGKINDGDISLFVEHLTDGAKVEFQGGYLTACLDAAYASFEKGVRSQRSDVELNIDFTASTTLLAPLLSELRNGTNPSDPSKQPLIDAPNIIPPSFEIKTIADVIKWVNSNSELNKFWLNAITPIQQKSLETQLKYDQMIGQKYE